MFVQYYSKLVVWHLRRKDPASLLAQRVSNLASPVSDFRILLRYYGLVPLVQWIINSEQHPHKNSYIQQLVRLQNVCNVVYYPLEHIYWLALHGVVGIADKTRDRIGMWSCRCWALSVVLYMFQLVEEKKLLDHRKAKLSKDNDKKQLAVLKQDYTDWILNLVINCSYFPLTVHWSLESSAFPDVGVGLFGSIAAIAQLYSAWKAT